jgi:hypothetical protein
MMSKGDSRMMPSTEQIAMPKLALPPPNPYESQFEYIEGLRRVIQACRRRNILVYGTKDPGALAEPVERKGGHRDEEMRAVESELAIAGESHEARYAENRRQGKLLPVDYLFAENLLSPNERRIVDVLLVEATALCEGGRNCWLTCGEVARCVARWDAKNAQALLPYFLSSGRLVQQEVVEMMTERDVDDQPIRLGPGVLGRLLGTTPDSSIPARARAVRTNIVGFLRERGVELNEETLLGLRPVWGLLAHAEVASDKWGLGRSLHQPGALVLLFHGPSGTGKTLTARILGEALGRPTRFVSATDIADKYVGEAPRKLRMAFREAEKSGAVLVLDEADAVFGRRGEITRASERFCNAEVNSALTDIEQFKGICIMTTNNPDLLDPATERRFGLKLHFGRPGPETRARIWRAQVPKETSVAAAVDFGRLAYEYELTGGQIRNAVRAAIGAALARFGDEGDETNVTLDDFERAAEAEQRGCRTGDKGRHAMGFR